MKDNQDLVDYIKSKAIYYLDSHDRKQSVLEAMEKVDRIDFLPQSVKRNAYEDMPLPIGYGQTCSQPSMVAFMLDKLEVVPGNVILEIGSGCGYAAAIASKLCYPRGTVYAVEIIEELVDMMRGNLAGYQGNIEIISGDGSCGFQDYAPFDRILISAGVGSHFNRNILLEQLNNNGILIYPERYGNLYKVQKKDGKIFEEVFYGVSFVPLRGKNT